MSQFYSILILQISKIIFFTGNSLLKDTTTFRTSQFEIDDKMDKKLTNLCQLHDQICEIGISADVTKFNRKLIL